MRKMGRPIHIIEGGDRESDLCERCALFSRIDDSQECFYESELPDGDPTLRHRREGYITFLLTKPMLWEDTAPEYPSLAASSVAGCELCTLVLKGLLRRNLDRSGPVTIACSYAWGGYLWGRVYDYEEVGLSYMRCEVFDGKPGLVVGEKPIAYIVFPIWSNNSISEWLRTEGLICRDPIDPENVEWINKGLSDCEKYCGHITPAHKYIPTRLVDVGVEGTSEPRLISTASLGDETPSPADIKYATLSYCWGPKEDAAKQLRTTGSNLDSFCTRIPEEQLTPVIRDTIRVCRAIDIRYLWVDALCIIQGDKEDWDRESERMAMVYCHSYLTICPLSSHSCLEGFLQLRPPDVDIYFQSTFHDHINGIFTLYESHNDADAGVRRGGLRISSPRWRDYGLSTWQERGWTYQEDRFSSRMLFFGKSMLHLVCETTATSESGFVEEGPGVHAGYRGLFDMAYSGDRSEKTNRSVTEIWSRIYSVNALKYAYDTDILPSISGIAKACADVLEDTYMAGIWKRNLHFELIWYHRGHSPRGSLGAALETIHHPHPYIAPSWSWASHSGEHFDFLLSLYYIIPGGSPIYLGKNAPVSAAYKSAPTHLRSEITFIDYVADLEGHNPYGRIKNVCLTLRGKLIPPPSEITIIPRNHGRENFGFLADKIGTLVLDWSVSKRMVLRAPGLRLLLTASCCQATSNSMEFYAHPEEDHTSTFTEVPPPNIELKESDSCCDGSKGKNAWGIVLYPAQTPGAYVRVGIFILFGGSWGSRVFEDVADSDVKLV